MVPRRNPRQVHQVILTQEIIDNILAKHGNCEDVDCGIIIQGSGLTFTAVTLE